MLTRTFVLQRDEVTGRWRNVRKVRGRATEVFNLTTMSIDKGGYTLVTLPRIVTPYRDSVDGTRDRVTYQKLVTR